MSSGRYVTPVPAGGRLRSDTGGGDDFLARVAKYVPAEIIAGYLFLNGLVVGAASGGQIPGDPFWWNAGIFLLAWVLTPAYLWRNAPAGQPKAMQTVISTIAFPIWAYAIGGAIFAAVFNSFVASIALGIFSLVSGLFTPRTGDP